MTEFSPEDPCPYNNVDCNYVCSYTDVCREKLAKCPTIKNQLYDDESLISNFTKNQEYAKFFLKGYCASMGYKKKGGTNTKRKRRRNTKKKKRNNKKK